MSGAPGSTYQGRRHAAEALYGEAAKRPSISTHTHTHFRFVGSVAIWLKPIWLKALGSSLRHSLCYFMIYAFLTFDHTSFLAVAA